VKRADLERVLRVLERGERTVFVEWDVHRAIDDDAIGSFDPHREGHGQGFIAWSKTADASFERDVLTQPLALQFGGDATALQMAFANSDLTVRIDVDPEDDELYGQRGTVVIAPDAVDAVSDLRRLLGAFAKLRAQEVIALPCTAFTQSDGWSDVTEYAAAHSLDRDGVSACFWTTQGHRAFDAVGRLESALHLYWRGDAERIAEILRQHAFSVRVPNDDHTSIQIEPTTKEAPFIARFADVLPNEPRVGSRPKLVAVKGGGPFLVEVACASVEKKPVRYAAVANNGARVALGHDSDLRGQPTHSLVFLDVKGVVVAQPERRQWAHPSCIGVRFLDDDGARAIVVWYDHLPRNEWSVRTPKNEAARVGGRRVVKRDREMEARPEWARDPTKWDGMSSAAVLEIVDVDARAHVSLKTLRSFGFSHGPTFGGLGLTRDHKIAAVASTDGIVLVDVESGEERACVGGKPLEAYPALALSADGKRAAWTTDAGPVVRIVDVANGACVDGRVLEHYGPRGIRDLAFDASGAILALLCRRTTGDVDERSLEILDATSGKRTARALEQASSGARSFAFHPTLALCALGFSDGSTALVDVATGKERGRAPMLDGAVTALAFSDDGARFVCGDEFGGVCFGRVDV
jgi:hypothetical protein